MALPVGVTTATITFGVPVTFTGAFVRSTVSIQPSAPLVHTATGTPLLDFVEDVVTTEGTSGQFTLPHTDQTGFQDENGNSYQNWYYTATITYDSNKGRLPSRTKTFQLVSGQTVVDLDLIPSGAPVLPYTAATGTVTSLNGRTGAVTVQESDLPERLSEGELSATYGPSAEGMRTAFLRHPKPSLVTLGDSRTSYDGGVTAALGAETSVYKASRGYVSQALVELRQRLRFLANGGVGGDTVAQMLARTDALLALNPGWLVGFGFANSLSGNVTAASIIADLTTIFDKCDKAGVRVVWGTDWIETTRTTAQKAVGFQVNEWLRSLVGTRRNFVLADYAAVMSDPATGGPVAAYAFDGLHQTPTGARIMGKELAAVLTPLVPRSDRLISTNADPTNLIPNGMLVGGATYATSWGFNGTGSQGVASKVARTDGFPGEWQQIAVTAQTDYQFRSRIVAGTTGSWVVGDTVYAECEFETDAAGWAATQFNLNISLYGTPVGTVSQSADLIKINGTLDDSRIASGIFRTPPITILAGCTTVDVIVQLKGTGTYRIARAALKRV